MSCSCRALALRCKNGRENPSDPSLQKHATAACVRCNESGWALPASAEKRRVGSVGTVAKTPGDADPEVSTPKIDIRTAMESGDAMSKDGRHQRNGSIEISMSS